jgi:CBS domain containing-hemolysin-like protein
MRMNLNNTLIPTQVATSGMTVRDVYTECVRAHVQAIPYCNALGEVTGRVTLKNVMKLACLPEYMVELAHILDNGLSCQQDIELKVKEMLTKPIEPFVQAPPPFIKSTAPTVKALAMMEQRDTSYLFVVDNGEYKGIITIQGIAQKMLVIDLQL